MKVLKSIGLMLFGLGMSVGSMAQTELASWTFDSGYDVAEGVYTPNESEWTEVKAQWFNAGAPKFVANSAIGNAADYIVTGSTSRYWDLCSGYNNQVFRITNDTESNNITDYTDASQHANYYEVQFPTKGYTNIKMELANAYGGNAEATLQSVISTDGGTTWMVGEVATTASGWWLYNANTLAIPATDCEKVIVRLIFGNGFSSNWNMDYIKLTGEEYTGEDENMFTFSAGVNPAGAGSVVISPISDRYESGTEITLTQTANMGYSFLNWTDAEGNVLGTEETYTFAISENTTITANYEEAELPAGTAVTLASWTFDNGYTSELVDNGITLYTPDASAEWTAIGHFFFADQNPCIRPDACMGSMDNYSLTAKSEGRYWQLCEGYYNKVFRIENNTANAITDFTDASQHNAYYQILFPTKGYEDITIDYAIAYGQNAEATIEAVVSTDGGKTWYSAGSGTTAPNWWIYNANSLSLSANNKDSVIVRLIAGNDFANNWNLDYLTVKAVVAEKEMGPVDLKDYTLTWPFHEGPKNPTTAEVTTPGLLSVAEFSLGSELTITGIRTDGGIAGLTQFQPVTGQVGSNEEHSALSFTAIPKRGITITPKQLSFKAARVGTNGGSFDVVVISGDDTITVAKDFTPQLVKDSPYFSECVYDLTALPATTEQLVAKIYIKGLANNKQYAFSDIVITADVEGTVLPTPSYTLAAKVGMEGAGNISINPSGAEFDEGTMIELKASQNFGYHFVGWYDAEGNEVSTDNPYKFQIAANTDLTARYTQSNVYALNLKVIDDMENIYSNGNLVTIVPEGNIVDGIRYYEEGTDVKLTVNNNKILSFTGWEDGTTNAERIINMDGEKSLTVNYAVADYIVAWDFYQDSPNTERAADYRSNSENGGLLSLRKADGTTGTWLTRGVNNGAEEGRWGARIWRLLSDGWYWEVSFSTKGFSNITLSNGFGHSYNTYAVMRAEYSVDGENFTKLGTYDIPVRGWVDGEFTLPEEANNQERVWIRWLGDTETLTGNESDYDGLSIGDIFVMGESEQANDEVAPVLVNTNPENGATGASATGSIVLTFDERIKAGTGSAILGEESIAPTVNGKTAIFQYSGLEYNTQYTFTLPAGVITDRSGNAYEGLTIQFTTMERTQPVARLYDAVVAADGSGDYLTVQEAIDAAPEGRAIPWLIFIKNGEYKGHVDIPKNKPYLHFIGQERDKVIITDDLLCGGDNALHVSVGATVVVNSNDCYFDNLTLENSWGHDNQAGPQALALNTIGDRTVFKNVAMLSYQDTWITPSTSNYRAYVKDCFIEGAVDFIYNSGNIYIDNTTLYINRKSGGYIVAPSHGADVKWGYVFMNCTITAPGVPSETDVWLGRPWHNNPKTVFINTIAEVTIPAKGWYPTMGGLPVLWAEYNTMDANGNPLDLSQRESSYYYLEYYKIVDGEEVIASKRPSDEDMPNWSERKIWTHNVKNTLTAEEAAQYTVKNVLSGDDNWQPNIITESCAAPKATFNEDKTSISWEAVPYAICYVIIKNGTDVEFTTETSVAAEAGATYMVYAANEQGGLSEGTNPDPASGIENVVVTEADIVAIYSVNGVQLKELQEGINIVKLMDKNGNTVIRKIIK